MTSDTVHDYTENESEHKFHLVVPSDDDDEQPKTPSSTSSYDEYMGKPQSTYEDEKVEKLYANWLSLDEELRAFENKHKTYVSKLDEVESLKTQYRTDFNKYNKKVAQLQKDVNRLKTIYSKKDKETIKPLINRKRTNSQSSSNLSVHSSLPPRFKCEFHSLPSTNSSPSLDKLNTALSVTDRLAEISEHLNTSSLNLSRISETLPRKDPYLKVILGGVDVSILNKIDRWKYKEEYEKFKFIITGISLISSVTIWSLASGYRAFDAMFHFLLVWYYCTLTIRESILTVNGSHINAWWRAHHFISTVATGILLTWPESHSYHAFVQGLQFYYQRGCLYRLRALGETHDMDITIEGFHRWMFRGLSFIVPFLIVGYLFQLYNAYTLWKIAHRPETHEWQVYVLAIIFFVLFLGNCFTTMNVLREKFREKPRPFLTEKYQSLKTILSKNYHRRTLSWNSLRNRDRHSKKAQDLIGVSKLQ